MLQWNSLRNLAGRGSWSAFICATLNLALLKQDYALEQHGDLHLDL